MIMVIGSFIVLLGIIFIIKEIDDALCGIGCTAFLLMGALVMVTGVMKECETDTMKEHNINPAVIKYIVDVRSQKDETSIATDNAIAIYIECKRNGLTDEETISFLLPDITKEEAKSVVKTYNLLRKEN